MLRAKSYEQTSPFEPVEPSGVVAHADDAPDGAIRRVIAAAFRSGVMWHG